MLCELIPGGVPGQIIAGQAARILESITPADAVAAARCELAAGFTADLRGIDAAVRDARKKLAIAVAAAGTSLTGLFGVGPAAQRRPQGVHDPAAREPIMPRSGKQAPPWAPVAE
jgi:hypothetical protein